MGDRLWLPPAQLQSSNKDRVGKDCTGRRSQREVSDLAVGGGGGRGEGGGMKFEVGRGVKGNEV